MKRIIFILSFLAIQLTGFSQLGVGTNSPDASAQLDVTATNKGFLAPRIALTSTSDVTTIASPATGLMVYNTATAGTAPSNVIPGYYYFNGIKWVRFINNQPDATIDFNTANPNSGSPTFTPNTPQSSDYIYVSSVDASQWIWNGSTYVTYTAPASTPWYLANTTNDAGSNKTANIWRSGNVGVNTTNPTFKLHVLGNTRIQPNSNNNGTGEPVWAEFYGKIPPGTATSAGGLKLGWYNSYGGIEILRPGGSTGVGLAFNYADESIGTTTEAMRITTTGNVGIGTVAPSTKLHIQGIQATLGANANATMLRMSRPTWSGFKWGSAAQFNLGTYVDAGNNVDAKSRLDLALTNGNNETTLTTVMTWLANGRVGINNTDPNAPLVVQGATGTGTLKLIAPSVAAGDNWWIGFGHGTTSTDANDRARIGAEIIAGGAGRLFFTTGPTGTQTRAMFIDETQRVGIGTSTPTSKLDVSTGVTTTNSIVNATGSINDYLQYNIQNTSTGTQAQSGYSATANNGSATSGFAWLGINNSNFNFPTSYNIGGANDVSFIGSGQDMYVANANNTKSIIFSTGRATTPFFAEQMRILNNGNVGIGSSNPLNKLVVKGLNNPVSALGTAQTNAILRVEGESNHSLDMGTLTASPYGSYIQSHNKASVASLPLNLNPVGGNVGIGTVNPTQSLDVNGQVRIRTINSGAATDSLLVVNGGVVKSVSRSATVNTQTANYTLTTSDNGAILIMNSASAVTVTVPATLPAGFVVQIIQKGAGQITVTGSGSTINSANGLKSRTLNSAIGVVMETSTLGYVTGDSNF